MNLRNLHRVLVALLMLLGLGLSVQAAPAGNRARAELVRSVEGVVSKVHDGDSLWIKPQAQPPIVVRLRDIDAPELCQSWGEEAQRALSELALGKPAVLYTFGRDSHGRTLGKVQVDDVDLARRMVEDGNAWSIRSRWDLGPLVKQERMAKALGRGLHSRAGAEPPWKFRATHGPCTMGEAAVNPVAHRVAAQPGPASPPAVPYRCDGRTRCTQMSSCEEAKFFLANCPGAKMDGNRDGVPCQKQWCR